MQNLCHLFYPNATRIIPAVISPIPAALIAETVSCRKTTAAVAVSTACLMLVTVVSMALMIITGCSLCDALFDTCSAFGLGGYSVGVASESSPTVLYILAATMFIGRLGPLTIAYAISRPHNLEAVRYPTEQIVVG